MKKGYRLAEICRKLDLQPYVLRYWATEFPLLETGSGSSAQRLYSEQDLALLKRIKRLLYEEGYTIAGAKKKLESDDGESAAPLFDESASEEPAETTIDRLDSAGDERIESLRRGVAEALREAREILSLLKSE
jgi:DNA-binding transcriptional MerR regulator